MTPDFKHRLRRRELLVGPIVSLASPEVAELLALAGFDWLWIEMEHAFITFAQAADLCRIASALGCSP